MKQKIDERWLEEVRTEYWRMKRDGSSKEELGRFIERKAESIGKSTKTLYARLKLSTRKVSVPSAVAERRKDIDRYARLVFDFAESRSRDDMRVDWKLAFEVLQENETVPKEVSLQQVYSSIKRQNLATLSQAVIKSWEREHGLSLVQIDYTRSDCFRHVGEGVLEMGEKAQPYKDADDRRRVWLCVAVDDASRVVFADYVLSEGESQVMTQEFMFRAFAEKDRLVNERTGEAVRDNIFQGIPKSIYWDRGPGHKSATVAGLEYHGIGVISGNNKVDGFGKKTNRSNKGAHGKVESANGEIKGSFERRLWLAHRIGWRIHIDELNALLLDWCRKVNLGKHPTRPGEIRWDIFNAALAEAQFPQDNFLVPFAAPYRRKVQNRLIRIDNDTFVAPELCENGKEYDIMKDPSGYWLVTSGKRFLLEGQREWHKKHNDFARIEQDEDMLSERDLKVRLDEEIKLQSRGELKLTDMRLTHKDDLLFFYEKPRSIGEIKSLARVLVSERSMRPTNIITVKIPHGEND